jgi:hypothetical protein
MLLAAGACSCTKNSPVGKDGRKLSRVATEFQASWVFGGEYQITETPQGKRPDPGAEAGAYRVTGALVTKTGTALLDAVMESAVRQTSAKLGELGLKVCDVKRSSAGEKARQTLITYESDAVTGAVLLALRTGDDAFGVGYTIDVTETVKGVSKPPGGG